MEWPNEAYLILPTVSFVECGGDSNNNAATIFFGMWGLEKCMTCLVYMGCCISKAVMICPNTEGSILQEMAVGASQLSDPSGAELLAFLGLNPSYMSCLTWPNDCPDTFDTEFGEAPS